VVLNVSNLVTVTYCRHFHAYEVKKTSQCSLVNLEELEHPYTEVIHCVGSKHYVTLRYHISGNVMKEHHYTLYIIIAIKFYCQKSISISIYCSYGL